jgi:molybdopterin synthase sulfur carrier subunit
MKLRRHIGRIQPVAETNVIRVRYWAAAKAAAGTDSDHVQVNGATTLAELRAAAAAVHPGTRLAEVLAACSTLVGEQPVGTADPATYVVEAGSSVEFLPPFAGG